MIQGIGLDIVELKRIEKLFHRKPTVVDRILTSREKERLQTLSPRRQVEYISGRFAAKEAFAKALGTGIGADCAFTDIDVLSDERGAPYILFKGKKEHAFITITHTETVAAAQVIRMKGEQENDVSSDGNIN